MTVRRYLDWRLAIVLAIAAVILVTTVLLVRTWACGTYSQSKQRSALSSIK
jgi:hypothetical protein